MTTKLTGLPNARHRLAALRNRLHNELANLKSGSTIYKTTKGRMGGVMDAIEICDQELLAQEQGEPTELRPDQVAWLVGQRGNP
jgi:hypothetical protein